MKRINTWGNSLTHCPRSQVGLVHRSGMMPVDDATDKLAKSRRCRVQPKKEAPTSQGWWRWAYVVLKYCWSLSVSRYPPLDVYGSRLTLTVVYTRTVPNARTTAIARNISFFRLVARNFFDQRLVCNIETMWPVQCTVWSAVFNEAKLGQCETKCIDRRK